MFYVRDNYPDPDLEAELARVEGGFGLTPKKHYFTLREMLPELRGLAILDNDGKQRVDSTAGGLQIVHWQRYEAQNYFVTPEVLRRQAAEHYQNLPLFAGFADETEDVLDSLLRERVFGGDDGNFATWKGMTGDGARLVWETTTRQIKLSDVAEEFFRRLAQRLGHSMLLRKGELHRLVRFANTDNIPEEVNEKLDLLKHLFDNANPGEEQ